MVDLVDNLILMEIIISGQHGVVLIHTVTPLHNLILQIIAVMVVRAVAAVVPAMVLIHPSSFCLGGTGGINNGSPAGTGSNNRPGGNAGANTGSGGGAGM